MGSVSVLIQAPGRGGALEGLLAPLLTDEATLEVMVVGASGESDRALGGSDGRVRAATERLDPAGDVVLFVDAGVLCTRGLVSGHARHHQERESVLVVGYTPYKVLHERVSPDFAARMRGEQYEARCEDYESDPATILHRLWGGTFSLRRDDALGSAVLSASRPHDIEVGRRAFASGLTGVFDRSLRGLRIYQPSLSEFVQDARAEGEGLAGGDGRPPSALARAESLAMRALLAAAGSAQVWRLQDVAARRLWLVERQRGEHAAV